MKAALHIKGGTFNVFNARDTADPDESHRMKKIALFSRGFVYFVDTADIYVSKGTNHRGYRVLFQGIEFIQDKNKGFL